MKHEMPKLPYQEDSLQPVISKETIEYHYGKHLQAYVNNLNTLIASTEFEDKNLEEIIKTAPEGGIFNNAGQVLNHTLYFLQFTPEQKQTEPSGKLKEAIEKTFGSFEDFKKEFSATALGLFGSGWAWLSEDNEGKLYITKETNASIPLREGRKPLLCFDVWEHAYYIDYRNKRADYINGLWKIIDWKVIENRMK